MLMMRSWQALMVDFFLFAGLFTQPLFFASFAGCLFCTSAACHLDLYDLRFPQFSRSCEAPFPFFATVSQSSCCWLDRSKPCASSYGITRISPVFTRAYSARECCGCWISDAFHASVSVLLASLRTETDARIHPLFTR